MQVAALVCEGLNYWQGELLDPSGVFFVVPAPLASGDDFAWHGGYAVHPDPAAVPVLFRPVLADVHDRCRQRGRLIVPQILLAGKSTRLLRDLGGHAGDAWSGHPTLRGAVAVVPQQPGLAASLDDSAVDAAEADSEDDFLLTVRSLVSMLRPVSTGCSSTLPICSCGRLERPASARQSSPQHL